VNSKYFRVLDFNGFKLLLVGKEPQDIGPSGKATTFAACRARKGKMTARSAVIRTLGCVLRPLSTSAEAPVTRQEGSAGELSLSGRRMWR